MNKYLKYTFIIIAVAGGLFLIGPLVFSFMIASAFGSFDKSYSVSELKEEYYSKEAEIKDLIVFYNQIKPQGKLIDIEFENDRVLSRLTIVSEDSSNVIYQQWDVSVSDLFKNDLKKHLNWSERQIEVLKEKLDKANCISVEDGEPIKIGFKRSGMGMYSFNVFQYITTDRSEFNNKCQYILVNSFLVLEYGGGAIGPQCFPGK